MTANSMPAIHIIARHWARPETVDEVRRLLVGLIEPSRAEPGCLRYELFENVDDPTAFTFVETFTSDEAFALHAAAPYITAVQPRLRPLIARPSEVHRYREVARNTSRSTA